jgi:hypothetical protein
VISTVNFAVIYGEFTVILRTDIVSFTVLTCTARALTCQREIAIMSQADEGIRHALELLGK